MRFPHLFHRDPHWQQRGVFAYYQCRHCGARRVRWVNPLLYGPVDPGWPELRDRHGRDISDSGWRKPDVPGTPLVVPHIDFSTPTGNPQVMIRKGFGLRRLG